LWPSHAESAVFLLGAPDDDALRLEKRPFPIKGGRKRAPNKRQSCIFKVTQASAFAFPSEAATDESKKEEEKKEKRRVKRSD
jgi:hypothetical protein